MKQKLFASATLTLTGWYLLVLAVISLMFSVVLYQVSSGEIERRLERYQEQSEMLYHLQPQPNGSEPDQIRSKELGSAKANLIIVLVYTNMVVLVLGGLISYLFARRTLEPIEAAHDQQARFVSDASHELRTPLATMTTELEVALRDPSLTKQEMNELLKSNLEEVQRLTKLSHTLLALTSGKTDRLESSVFELSGAIRSVIKAQHLCSERLSLVIPGDPVFVRAHQESIEELTAILLDNARKYSPESSIIAVHVTPHSGRAFISVSNTGDGIREQDIPHVFDRFYRGESSRSSEGYGLGLALARQISDLHMADLSVISTPGKTTQFTFSLPIEKEA